MASSNNSLPWVEKYRPCLLDNIVGNGAAVERLKIAARDGTIPNLLLTGPPGCGKTTSVLCLARHLLPKTKQKEAVLELNASDERGIAVVRDQIKTFAERAITLPANRHKLVILDEADNMTIPAQQSMRRIFERYANTTRFALACNHSAKIIEALQSRCVVLRFVSLTPEEMRARLLEILAVENITTYTKDGLDAVLFTADGDMRQALNNMQATHTAFQFISAENVYRICDQPHPLLLSNFLNCCVEKHTRRALDAMSDLWRSGFAFVDILATLFRVTKDHESIDEPAKLVFLKHIGFCQHALVQDGIASLLQLHGLAARMCAI